MEGTDEQGGKRDGKIKWNPDLPAGTEEGTLSGMGRVLEPWNVGERERKERRQEKKEGMFTGLLEEFEGRISRRRKL